MSSQKTLLVLALVALCGAYLVSGSSVSRVKRHGDRVRCKWFSGFFCRWSCRGFGHSDGFCDEQDECRCSEEELEKYVCGGDVKNTTADALCAGWCQFKGKQSGDCNVSIQECECTAEELEAGHVKCVNDEVCSAYCQFSQKKATGVCTGKNNWDCMCLSNDEKNVVGE